MILIKNFILKKFNFKTRYIEITLVNEKSHVKLMDMRDKRLTLRISLTAIFIALGVLLSYLNPFGYFVILGAKINPFAHLINVLTGVLIGLIFSSLTAFGIAIIRYTVGIGTIHAFHGGISGAIVVSIISHFLYKYKPKYVDYAAFSEPLGTVFIGGTIAELILPIYGTFSIGGMVLYWWLFFWSSLFGCILGFIILKVLRRAGYSREEFMD
jgi:energy coupling factor transporter S component ThiW